MVAIGLETLTIEEFTRMVVDEEEVTLRPEGLATIKANFDFLKAFSSDKLIYGLNTGFGPMAQYKISEENLLKLQYNLIRSHSSGSGRLLPEIFIRATMIARLSSMMKGYSGVHPQLPELLCRLINEGVYPCIYEHGGVGASGDLVQLAHLGLALIGEGEVRYAGATRPAAEVFRERGITPLSITGREGLAILNGTSAMTGIGMINIIRGWQLLEWAVLLSSMVNEIVEAYDDHYSHELNIVKHHPGQQIVAAKMREIVAASGMVRRRADHLYDPSNIEQEVFEDKVQEYYSLRCVTQVLGPVHDTLAQAEKVLVHELNSVSDNPVIDHVSQNIFHGGNFHGDYVSLEMDKLKIAITKLSMLAERQLNYLLNDKLNQKFPPFLNLGVLGLNFGMQGMQFTATSTVAENQTLSFPMYVHSIPNNNDNQDIVSMGTNSALMTARVIDNSFTVLSIHLMTVLQAVDFLRCVDRLSPVTRLVFTNVRQFFPCIVEDEPRHESLRQMREFLQHTDPIRFTGKTEKP
ncbi:MAG TPA: aromatic amino acid ammonia-lyase [Puia sp.]|nr:aromatic amino acid ammonia-lyase [Puia sp.]